MARFATFAKTKAEWVCSKWVVSKKFTMFRDGPLAGICVSGVRGVAELPLLVAAHRDLPRAPRLQRAHQDRRGKSRPDEHQLLKENALNRAKGAEQREQKRNRKDRRHRRSPSGDKQVRLFASALRNASPTHSVPAASEAAKQFASLSTAASGAQPFTAEPARALTRVKTPVKSRPQGRRASWPRTRKPPIRATAVATNRAFLSRTRLESR